MSSRKQLAQQVLDSRFVRAVFCDAMMVDAERAATIRSSFISEYLDGDSSGRPARARLGLDGATGRRGQRLFAEQRSQPQRAVLIVEGVDPIIEGTLRSGDAIEPWRDRCVVHGDLDWAMIFSHEPDLVQNVFARLRSRVPGLVDL